MGKDVLFQTKTLTVVPKAQNRGTWKDIWDQKCKPSIGICCKRNLFGVLCAVQEACGGFGKVAEEVYQNGLWIRGNHRHSTAEVVPLMER